MSDTNGTNGDGPVEVPEIAEGEIPPRLGIEPIAIQEEMERSFLDYAMSVIVARALPDARDGLKPVHRRILYGMWAMGARSDRTRLKCAKICGEVMGNYHPHGDGAIYDALVRMAQPFSLRHPLIDFHGNYGSMDDGAAASRYTESRLAQLANVLLEGIDEDTVDFVPNYANDAAHDEPSVLPARFPNLLINGSQGIAVGMATNIPPHNLAEIIDATVHLIDNPEATATDLMHFVKGPDFPTGGFLLGRQGIIDAYTTGRGSIKMRGRATIEDTRRGFEIVITELPYQVGPKAVLAKVAELANDKTLDGIADAIDQSAGGKVKLVIPLKRDANPQVVLNNLYKLTPLQTSFGVNMVALVGASGGTPGVPRTLNLVQALQAYVEHQVEVLTRRSQHRLAKARRDEHLREGRLKAVNVIDAIIALIRSSDDRRSAKTALMAEPYEFSEVQADDILEMRLGQLTRLARVELEQQLSELRTQIAELERILGDPAALREVIKDELEAVRDKYADDRRTELTIDDGEIVDLDLIDDEPLVITMTRAGWVKSLEAGAFRNQGRGGKGVTGAKLKEEDLVTEVLHTSAHAFLLCFSNRGKVYRLRAYEIPIRERAAKGTPIVNLLPLAPEERIQTIIDTRDFDGGGHLFFATRCGQVKKTLLSAYDKSRRDGFIAIKLLDGDELVRVIKTGGDEDILMVSRKGMAIRFAESDVRALSRDSQGVRGMGLRTGDELVSCDVCHDERSLLLITDAGYGKRTQLTHFRRQTRGGVGLIAIRLSAKKGKVVAAFMVHLDDEIVLMSSGGVVIRTSVREISSQGRDATGVRVMNMDAGDHVAAVAPIEAVPDPEPAA
ncbi:MAG: DNA gyrase subunit A [Acidimicrobiales bacterium]